MSLLRDMAMLCRCDDHGWPDGTKNTYVAKFEPAGGTSEALICGGCENPGDIYLNDWEYYHYEHEGERLFSLKEAGVLRIKVSDSPEEVEEHLTRDEDNPPDEPKEPLGDSAAETDW